VSVTVYPSMWPLQPPISAYDWSRMQYRADAMNRWLRDRLSQALEGGRLALGIVSADGYVEGLNFVFGLASPELNVATVYTKRLETPDETLYRARLLKEAMHELGHLLGLGHCDNPACVMSFSNTIADVDRKEARFCSKCTLFLRAKYG